MEETIKTEVKDQMGKLEAGSYKPRVSTEQMLDFVETLAAKNVNVQELVNSQDLRRLAYGKMTSKLYAFTEERNGKRYEEQGKFYVNGKEQAAEIKAVTRFNQEVDRSQYKGHTFTPEEKNNLFQNSQAGAVVEIDVNHGKEGMEPKMEKCYVSFDRDLNRFKAVPAEKISGNTFKKFFGHEISDENAAALKEGKPVVVELPDKQGKQKKTVLQFDTYEFGLKQYPLKFFAPRKFLNVELTDAQREALGDGQAVELKGLQKKDGTTFDAKIKLGDNAKVEFEPREKQAEKKSVAEKPKVAKVEKPKVKNKKSNGPKL